VPPHVDRSDALQPARSADIQEKEPDSSESRTPAQVLGELVEEARHEQLAELKASVDPKKFDIIMACKEEEKIYIQNMTACARESLVNMQKNQDCIDDFDDLEVSRSGFDVKRQNKRRRLRRDIVTMDSMKKMEADARTKRTLLKFDLATELIKVMGDCPADDLPLATFSRQALAMWPCLHPPHGSPYQPDGVQEECRVPPSQASDQGKKGPASHGSTLDPNYTRIMAACGLIQLPDDFTGRKAPLNVIEKRMSDEERQYRPHEWATWWMEEGGFQARHKCTMFEQCFLFRGWVPSVFFWLDSTYCRVAPRHYQRAKFQWA